MAGFSDAELKQVSCIACGASPGQSCSEQGVDLIGYHKERIELREKLPVLPPDMPTLDATDKAIICYYAFVALCNSCQTKSVELFGKQFSSREIQYAFATQGLKAAKADGLLGIPPEDQPQLPDLASINIKMADEICTQCNRPFSHAQHTPGALAYHPPVTDGHVANRHERRSPEHKRKLIIM